MSANPPIDLELLIKNAGGDEAFVREIVGMCIEQAEKQISTLKDLCVDGVSDAWRETAHALKGTAGTIGAEDMRLLCEVAQKQMLDSTAVARRAKIGEIDEKYQVARQALKDLGY
ncbi:MAG TPA: Hpt domain-containing protein [Alphaproteobacteria bacterium]